jgi:hypothetical protein
MHGRIWFEGNPWPEGHPLAEFAFQILLDESGPRLLLHLRTEEYDAEDDQDVEAGDGDDDWLAKGAWGNYHACILSNTHWGVASRSAPRLDGPVPAKPETLTLEVDPASPGETLQRDQDDHAFHVYLLGHDAVGGHEIRIVKGSADLYEVSWSGLIALTYGGDTVFRHRFRAEIHDAEFGGFRIENPNPSADPRVFIHPKPRPPEFAARETRARDLAARLLSGAEILDFHAGKGFAPDFLKPRRV